MKKMTIRLLLILLNLFIANLCFSQINENRNFLYLSSDTFIYGEHVELKKPFFGEIYFIVDSIEIQPDYVKFYKNSTGFYANTIDLSFSVTSNFSKQIRKGKINLYEYESTNYSPGHINSTTGIYTGGIMTRNIKNYYNKGFDDLKKANYQNLLVDLSDNPESLFYLNKYKSIRNTQAGLYIAGGATLIAGIATLMNKTKDWDGTESEPEPNVTGNIVAMGIGAGCFWISYIIGFKKPKQLRRAIDAYNK